MGFSKLCALVSQLEKFFHRIDLPGSKLPDQIFVLDTSLKGDDHELLVMSKIILCLSLNL